MTHLHDLSLLFEKVNERMRSDVLVLNALEPPLDLEGLHIGEYRASHCLLD